MPSTPKSAIYQVLKQVPKGKVVTYGQLAQLAGLGKAARFVGTSLKNLPKDTALPWHRVINSRGQISFPEHHPNKVRQQELLIDEGIEFKAGKINLKQFLWRP